MKICIAALMELYFGAYKSQKTAGNLAKVKMLENSFEIISTGKESAEIFGMLKASLEKAVKPLDDFDLIVASCALANNLTLVSNNMKQFSRIEGLKLTNWRVFPEQSNTTA